MSEISVTFHPPEDLTGMHGTVWLAQDGRRTTTQIATEVAYTLSLVPDRRSTLGGAVYPPAWRATLAVPRTRSYLRSGAEVVLTLDDGRQAHGTLGRVRGWRTVRAELAVWAWLEEWQ